MTERSDLQAGDGAVPVIPYDTFEAANLFLATGRTAEEVLPLIGLSLAEWERLREAYRWFPHSMGDAQRRGYFDGLDDAQILRLVLPPRWRLNEGDAQELRSTWHVREEVRRKPHIGPFKDCDWSATWIAPHPESSLFGYTHDGRTVYFNGKPLIDRKGEALEVDARSFEPVGGRWLRDKDHVYGQGEFGPRPTPYWYVVERVERASFQALNLRYARDGGHAFYITGKTIRTRSPEAFEIVPEMRLNYRDGTRDALHDVSHIARDREAVYFYGARLKGARPDHFRELGRDYATDGETVWFLETKKVVDGAEAESFTVPGPGEPYVVDGQRGGAGVTDRFRPYVRGEPCDPEACFEDWRLFFGARPDLTDWWWHRLANEREIQRDG